MRSRFACVACAAICGLAAGPGSADTVIDTYPFWDNNVTNGWLMVAQSFIAPADNVLDNYMFGFDETGVDITFTIVPWDETSGPTGGPLFTDNFVSASGDNLVSGIGLALTPGNMYAAIVDMNGYSASSVHWMQNTTGNPTGDASWWNGTWDYLNSGWSTKFRAEFIVPAPGALALLGLAGVAAPRRRRRR